MSVSALLGNLLPFQVDGLIVGLGNPGPTYAETPHNIGFQALDALAMHWKTKFKPTKKLPGEVATASFNGKRYLLVKPHTYMNLSGNAVAPLIRLYELKPEALFVLVDEINLPLGQLRIRGKGSAGGQNGMKHIIRVLNGEQGFPRLRFGIGPQPESVALEDYVLRPYDREQFAVLPELFNRSTACIETYLSEGLQEAQNRYNR